MDTTLYNDILSDVEITRPNVKFDYNFSIRSIVAIAPADGQYKPAGHLTPLENINYLVIHGGHDADAAIFMGIRQFNRVHFTDDNFWFKSAIYIYRANHNQFNTVWGKFDATGNKRALLNQQPIMALEKQRQVAKAILSQENIEISAYTLELGGIRIKTFDMDAVDKNMFYSHWKQ